MKPVHILSDVSPVGQIKTGWVAVTAAAQAIAQGVKPTRAALLRAPSIDDDVNNTEAVYIGKADVTADTTITGGFSLAPGASIEVPVDDLGKLYVISANGSQYLNWMCV